MRNILAFVYLLLVGCSNQIFEPTGYQPICDFDVRIWSDLPRGNVGDYKLEWQDSDTQTFGIIKANIGHNSVQKVAWQSDYEVYYQGQWINLVNQASYSTEDGIATTVLGVFENFIGDVITVAIGFKDECGTQYFETCTVEVVNEE